MIPDVPVITMNMLFVWHDFQLVWTVLRAEDLAISCDSHVKTWHGLEVWTFGMLLWVSFLLGWLGWSTDLLLRAESSGSGTHETDETPSISFAAASRAVAKILDSAIFLIRMRSGQNRGLRILQVYRIPYMDPTGYISTSKLPLYIWCGFETFRPMVSSWCWEMEGASNLIPRDRQQKHEMYSLLLKMDKWITKVWCKAIHKNGQIYI